MTKDADFKKLVRQQMAVTGQSYTAARAAIYRPACDTQLPLARRAFGLKTSYLVRFVRDRGQVGGAGEYPFRQVVAWGHSANLFWSTEPRLHLRPDETYPAWPIHKWVE